MDAWWPLEAGPVVEDVARSNNGTLIGGGIAPGKVGNAAYLDGISDHIAVGDNGRLDPHESDFTIDAWIATGACGGSQPIVSNKTSGSRGYRLALSNGALELTLAGDVARTFGPAGPMIADFLPHHVAASVEREGDLVLWVDGVEVLRQADDVTGSIEGGIPLTIGKGHVAAGQFDYFKGMLDEVEIFIGHALDAVEVSAIYRADHVGKCKDACHVTKRTQYCDGFATATALLTIWNHSLEPQTYAWTYADNPGAGCDVVMDPGLFDDNFDGGPVAIDPGHWKTIGIHITPPQGMTHQDVGCYTVTVMNEDSNWEFTHFGEVVDNRNVCTEFTNANFAAIHPEESNTTGWVVTSGGGGKFAYRLTAGSADGDASNQVVSLGGLPPGTPVTGAIVLTPGVPETLSVEISMTDFQPFRAHDVLLELDTDFDAVLEPLSAIAVHSARDTMVTTIEPAGPAAQPGPWLSMPTPYRLNEKIRFHLPRRNHARLHVFDVGGRRIATLLDGIREQGVHRVAWNGRDTGGQLVSSGVYFVRLTTEPAGEDVVIKTVLLR